jgi:sepiapterin reductase
LFKPLVLTLAGFIEKARDMYHACLAKEMEGADANHIKILNYAPGPLETDMAEQIRAADDLDITLKPHYQKKLIEADESANVLVRLILENTFTSGSHVDFFDVPKSS